MSLSLPPIYVLEDNDYEMLRLKKDVAIKFMDNVKDTLMEEDINFTGDLSTSLSLVIDSNNNVSVETNNPYAHFVEWGLDSGKFVNVDELRDWVRIKLDIPDEMLEEVTWKIVNKIKNEGIKPKRFWKRSILKLIKKYGSKTPRQKRGKSSRFNKVVKSLKKVARQVRKVARFMKKNISKREHSK